MTKKDKIIKQSYYPWWNKKCPLKITRINIKKDKACNKSGKEYALVIRTENIDNEYNTEI